jgi:hypothetical protein
MLSIDSFCVSRFCMAFVLTINFWVRNSSTILEFSDFALQCHLSTVFCIFRVCLPYVPATDVQVGICSLLTALQCHLLTVFCIFRFCLPYVPATDVQVGNVLTAHSPSGLQCHLLTVFCIFRFCLPYVPATDVQVGNVLTALKGRSGTLIDIGRLKKNFLQDGFINSENLV